MADPTAPAADAGVRMLVGPQRRRKVMVHPVVLFSIIDHFLRRNEGQSRVIGTLLGTVTENTIVVKNCFPVPHIEKGDEEVAVGKDFNREMTNLHSRINSSEELIGWYATADGILINERSCLIHSFYGEVCEDPLHLVVDTSVISNTLAVKAYTSSVLSVESRTLAATFQELCVDIVYGESEKIGVDMMLKGSDLVSANSNAAGSAMITNAHDIETEIANLEQSIIRLLTLIETAQQFVNEVRSGSRDKNQKECRIIGAQLADVLSAVPRIQPEVFQKSFSNNVQDLLMVVYLTNLTRTQLAIAEKLGQAAAQAAAEAAASEAAASATQ